VHPLDTAGKIFTIVLIIVGVGTALYAFSVVPESLVKGHLRQHFERRRMERDIARMSGHTIVAIGTQQELSALQEAAYQAA
jgi:voltage-gated potassium channel